MKWLRAMWKESLVIMNAQRIMTNLVYSALRRLCNISELTLRVLFHTDYSYLQFSMKSSYESAFCQTTKCLEHSDPFSS